MPLRAGEHLEGALARGGSMKRLFSDYGGRRSRRSTGSGRRRRDHDVARGLERDGVLSWLRRGHLRAAGDALLRGAVDEGEPEEGLSAAAGRAEH